MNPAEAPAPPARIDAVAPVPCEFHYRARFAAHSFLPGHHLARVRGGGIEVAALVPLERARDPRRLDWRASLRDPFHGWWVREHHQRSGLNVVLLVDVSASMGFAGRTDKRSTVLAFAESLRHSVARTGDAYGQVAFDTVPLPPLQLRPTRARHLALAATQALAAHAFRGRGAGGLAAAAAWLPHLPALVFLVSDFHFPVAQLDDALGHMPQHDVVPVWLHDPAELEALPAHGLYELRDAESGRARMLWLRPALRQRWVEQVQAHRRDVLDCLSHHQRVPLWLDAGFDADRVTGYFAGRR